LRKEGGKSRAGTNSVAGIILQLRKLALLHHPCRHAGDHTRNHHRRGWAIADIAVIAVSARGSAFARVDLRQEGWFFRSRRWRAISAIPFCCSANREIRLRFTKFIQFSKTCTFYRVRGVKRRHFRPA
jgi:hypothetical protein